MKKARWIHGFNFLTRLILPPVCPMCDRFVDEPNTLCAKCFGKLNFITQPYCIKCGRPFEFDIKGEMMCAGCIKENPLYHSARSILVYDDGSKNLILPFKHADRTELSNLFGKFLLRDYESMIADADMIIPVPLYITRLLKRKYNQAALLAKYLSKKVNVAYEPNILYRKRNTVSQGHMSRKERYDNVKGAFGIKSNKSVSGLKIILVDDVMTTGATINECTKILLKAGAEQVDVLTVARVIR